MEELLSLGEKRQLIPAVNYHLWQPCCMKCKFCFARFKQSREHFYGKKEDINKKNSFIIINSAYKAGISKISFAGGEPLLCPWLSESLSMAKQLGMTTMVISNGYYVSEKWLSENAKNIDWLTLSVDSLSHQTNLKLGRSVKGKTISQERYFKLVSMIKQHGIRLKINTTVTKYNRRDNFVEFMKSVAPERWKIFQVLPVKGQNDLEFDSLKVNNEQFLKFVDMHKNRLTQNNCCIVPENNDAMRSSYLMIDPSGRFYDNEAGFYHFSDPIWNIGWENAIKQISISSQKFSNRGGLYNWQY